ncbi:MAG TPA: DUF192 domain-containing protein [Anaerolineales bacterium]|nr:DUF192 domain-containing protein [Anaerolineales bacterium]
MNETSNILVNGKPLSPPIHAKVCKDFLNRFKGLMLKRDISTDYGIILAQKNESRLDSSIHMLGVFMDLGIIWINSKMIIVDTVIAKPWRPFYIPSLPAMYTLEVNPTRITEFHINDKVTFNAIA